MTSQSSIYSRFKLGRIVRLGFGTIVVVMVGVGVSSKLAMNRVVQSNEWITHTHAVIGDIHELEKQLVDAETGQRGYLFTSDENFLEPYNTALETIDDTFLMLKELTSDNADQQERLGQVEALIDAKLSELATTIELKHRGQDAELLALVRSGQGKIIMDDIRVLMDQMQAAEEDLLEQRTQAAVQAAQLADRIALGGTLLAVGFGVLALALISRQVIAPIHQVAEALSSSSSEMATTVQEQESSAHQQASAVQETSTTMDELKVSSLQSSEHAEFAAASAEQVKALATSGTHVVNGTIQDMNTICKKVDSIVEQIKLLSDQAQQIAGITDFVSDLANQTNMLALNAAVEAVRAGEHGKGFSVVAGEIRKLADQSKGSAEQIQSLIGSIQNAVDKVVISANDGRETVEQGAKMVQKTADTFMEVATSIDEISNSSHQISMNAKQQVNAIQQVVEAITSLNHEAVRGASSISQTRVGAQQLNEAVLKLQVVV